jgi:hypothetical protein
VSTPRVPLEYPVSTLGVNSQYLREELRQRLCDVLGVGLETAGGVRLRGYWEYWREGGRRRSECGPYKVRLRQKGYWGALLKGGMRSHSP